MPINLQLDSTKTRYPIIDNFIYLFHTNEIIVIPSYADSISDSMSVNFSSETPLSRSAPIYSYVNSGPRSMRFEWQLRRDMMSQINYGISNVKPDAGEDYVDYMIKAVQASALPEYDMALKMVNPPVIAVKNGDDIFIKGVVTGAVTVTYQPPIIPGVNPDGTRNNSLSRYANITIGFDVNEVDPYQASDVMKLGSFRGVPTTLERFIYGDIAGANIMNSESSGKGDTSYAGPSKLYQAKRLDDLIRAAANEFEPR